MDDGDRANRLMERERTAAATMRRPEGPAAIGECLWCGEPLEPGLRWCGPGCRDDWARLNERRGNGG